MLFRSLIPGLERLLEEEEIPTGSQDAETVAPEPAPDSTDSDPERVVELVEPEPAASEPQDGDEPGDSASSATRA